MSRFCGWGAGKRGGFCEELLSPAEALAQECYKVGEALWHAGGFPELGKLQVNLQEPPGAGSC